MEPFFFGDSKYPMYGVYHPPEVSNNKHESVLLCPSFGQEYMRSHRALRQLTLLLNRKGYHVMRFDYHGTGDSGGEMEDMTAQQWVEDVQLALSELVDMTEIDKVNVMGLRLGSLIAAQACQSSMPVERLILWDPIISGTDYINEITLELENTDKPLSNYKDTDGTIHFNGFPLGKKFQDGLVEYSLCEFYPSNAKNVLQIVSYESSKFETLKNSWKGRDGFEYKYTPAPSEWNTVDRFGGILLPQPIIQGIVNYLP